MKKIISILTIFFILIQFIIPINYPIFAEELVNITFEDENLYTNLKNKLPSGYITSYDDTSLTLTMSQDKIDSVTEIKLSRNGNSSILPVSKLNGIEYFKNLEHLNLSMHNIEDISKLSQLTNLNHLELMNNKITNVDALRNLTNLNYLVLSGNKLQIENLDFLSNLTNLETLYLNFDNYGALSVDVDLSDISALRNLTKLKTLSISGSNLEDISPLENLTSLESIHFGYNKINNLNPISNLTNLKSFSISRNSFDGEYTVPITNIDALSNLNKLRSLKLMHIQVEDLDALSGLTNLQSLEVSYDRNLTNIDGISNLTNLTWLELTHNSLKDITALRNLINVENLYIYGNEIEDISCLERLTKLEELRAYSNHIKDMSVINNFTEMYQLMVYNQTIEVKTDSRTVNLPPILLQAKEEGSIFYTESDYTLSNCTLSGDKKSVILDEGVSHAEVLIPSGELHNVKLVIDYEGPLFGATVAYSTTEITNQNITVTITANEEMNEVEGWTLSGDKKVLTKTYVANAEEDVIISNLTGESQTKHIQVNNIDKVAPEASENYSTKQITNEDVTVTITANEEIREVEGWTLSGDKKILTKIYTANKNESVTVYDLAGNTTTVNIDVANIDKIAPEIEVNYSTTTSTNQDVTVTITANEEMRALEGWTLSENKKVLTKTYTANKDENVTVSDLAGNNQSTQISVSNIDKVAPEAETNYSITTTTNQDVVVTITTNEQVKGIEGWTLSEDKKVLTKTYTTNGEETVTVSDLAGNSVEKNIKVNNIDKNGPNATVSYSTTLKTNQDVTVTITANEEIKEVEGWTLSEDKKVLTKVYTTNNEEDFSIFDLVGNSQSVHINVNNIDRTAPEVDASYSTEQKTNEDVTVTITANEEIKEVEGWTLSEDKTKLTKVFTKNSEETVKVSDLAGNSVEKNIKVNNIDKTGPELEVTYSTTLKTNEDITVTIKANEEIKEVEGWTLSEDKTKLTKVFTKNGEEEVTVYDLVGNKTKVKVSVTNITKAAKADEYQNKLPNGGMRTIISISIISLILLAFISYRKNKDFKGIR